MNSIYKSKELKQYPKVTQNLEDDIVIVGGGICGILLAHELSKQNLSVTLIDKKRIGNMASLNNTGKVSYLHNDLFYISKKHLKKHLLDNYKSVQNFKKLIDDAKIECEFENVTNHLFSTKKDLLLLKNVLDELNIKNSYNEKSFFANIKSSITTYDEFTYNPYLFIQNIEKNFKIYENTIIKRINYKDNTLITGDNIKIKYHKLVICTNFPFMRFKKLLGFKMYTEKSYLMSFSSDFAIKDCYIEIENTGISMRKYKESNIIVGGDHLTGKNLVNSPYDKLENTLKKYFKNFSITNKWFNIDTLTYDKLPLIGYLSDNVYIATGFNKWGMSSSFLASKIISEMISTSKKDNKDNIYNPNRCFLLKNPIKLIAHNFRKVYYLTTTIFTNKRCNHLGCRLKYNYFTGTFDCPCHGSCFEKEEIIMGPGYKRKV